MAKKKATPKREPAARPKTMEQLREEHPFETDSQIQNRYGEGRKKSGSESTPSLDQGRGMNR